MADPVSLGVMTAVSMGASAAGAAVSAYGAHQGGLAKKAMYDYQAGMAKVNAEIQRKNAVEDTKTGEVEAQQYGQKARFQMGKITVAQAASGIDVNSGSNVAVRDSQAAIARQDQSLIRSNAAKRAYAHEVGAVQEETQAGLYGMAGRNAEYEGKVGAVTSILGGVSSVSGKWADAKRLGVY